MMSLTPLTTALQPQPLDPEFMLDVEGVRLHLNNHSIDLTKKTLSLIGVLTLARLQERLQPGCRGWVTTEEIGTLPEWAGDRSAASLRSQIRREIRKLRDRGFDVIESEKLLRGPFRLRVFPSRNASSIETLSERFATVSNPKAISPEELFQWMEGLRPVWQAFYRFDKPQKQLSDSLELPVPDGNEHPVVAILTFIDRARRQRDLGDNQSAQGSLEKALSIVMAYSENAIVRVHLEASCHLHLGWNNYRWGRLIQAERDATMALSVLKGQGHLKIHAQILSLRSILRRIRKRYEDALQDLRRASEYWFIEGDLYNLFSVYHNLSSLVSDQAEDEVDFERRTLLLNQAIKYCQQSIWYCNQYKVGQNSVGSTIRLASLYTRLEDYTNAKTQADLAFEEAVEKENWAEATLANGHRIKLLLWKRRFSEADKTYTAFLKFLSEEPSLRSIAEENYKELLRQARETPGCLPKTKALP